jgi:endonuclease/exonuclease/phosphatase family metal-dependent hydrolase
MKLIQLNMEGDRHLERVIPFLNKENADVWCLQEIEHLTFERIKTDFGLQGVFAEEIKEKMPDGAIRSFGIAILTSLPILKSAVDYYQKHSDEFLDRKKPSFFERLHHPLISVECEERGKRYTVTTTHFPKSEIGSEVSEHQKRVFKSFSKLLDLFQDIILTGDTNCPRGTELFDALAVRYKDNIPLDVETTLDNTLHRHAPLMYVIDAVFTSKEYNVRTIRLQDKVSDHIAVIAEIERVS